jgi:hypothetical protein
MTQQFSLGGLVNYLLRSVTGVGAATWSDRPAMTVTQAQRVADVTPPYRQDADVLSV